ncbi:heparan sulfate 2-O-sulfotransferase pipe [Trichonephila inaurata madagascariensis]|uniref:Heparan sulfate 2-O-sulfotransferase pipe n=1 Tax=Trichonephila inaurata madagascariensis TaxID=2747483 RepID=A0A8X6WVK7_9ARAC|nr:heparan sulfate 2-O-sulfotransferase pipe [Trichonephila inaurata madagascariensis]
MWEYNAHHTHSQTCRQKQLYSLQLQDIRQKKRRRRRATQNRKTSKKYSITQQFRQACVLHQFHQGFGEINILNIIREPVERIISSFFYRRMVARQNKTKVKPSAYWLNKKFEHCVLTPDPECTFLEGHNYSVLQLPYFCGQEPECQQLNDPGAIQKAKQNIERYYSVVGTLEEMNITLQVLEAALPHFFRGAYHVYHTLGVHRNQNLHKEQVKEEVKDVLRANLSAEYELYYFVQQRLYQQYQTLVESKKKEGQISVYNVR